MKVFFNFALLILICGIFLCGCASSSVKEEVSASPSQQTQSEQPQAEKTAEPEPTPTPKPKRQQDLNIAVSIYDGEAARDELFVNGVEDIFRAKGNEYKILDAQGNAETQIKQIAQSMNGEFDALIIKTPYPDAAAEAINEAQAVMSVITVPQIEGIDTDYQIDTKETESAEEAAQILADSLDEGKKAVIISTGEQNASLTQKEQAFIEAAEKKELKIAGNKNAENREQAVAIISNWMLASPNIKGIWAPTPDALSAALEVVTVMERGDVKIGGIGEDLDFITALGDEKITVLGTEQPQMQGELAARAALVLGTENYYPNHAEASYAVYTPEQYKEAANSLWQIELSETNEESEEEN